MTKSEPHGVRIHDPTTDTLRTETVYTVLEDGRVRQLRLRVARGRFVDPWDTDLDVLEAMGEEPVL